MDCGIFGTFVQTSHFNILINSDYIKIFSPEIRLCIPGVIIRRLKNVWKYYIEGYDILCDGWCTSDKYIYYDINRTIYKIARPPYSELKIVDIPIECV